MQVSRVRPEGRDKARADLGLIVMPVVKRQEVNRLSVRLTSVGKGSIKNHYCNYVPVTSMIRCECTRFTS